MATQKRASTSQIVALLTTDQSPNITISGYGSGTIAIPNGVSYVALTYYLKIGGSYFAACDSAGMAITQVVAANKAYPMPAALFGAETIQIRADVAGSIRINLKS